MVIQDVAHVCPRYLSLVLILLVVSPVLLPLPLLVRELLVELLKVLKLAVLLISRFVFEHSSHPGDVVGLHSVVMFLVLIVLEPLLLFSHLLLAPLLLELGVLVLSLKEA